MELKKYQKKVLARLDEYLVEIRKYPTEKAAGVAFMTLNSGKNYSWMPEIGNAPYVCIKVPTGGGKTLIAANATGLIFKKYLAERSDWGLVMWLVPSDAIKTQTLSNLQDRKHPYREALDQRFNNKVAVFDLAEAKAIKKSDLDENLCIIVSTLSAFRRNDKEWLKAYQDNGALMPHFEEMDGSKLDFLDKNEDGEIIYSLANVIKFHNPLIIADEGHNVQTELSFDMLKSLNPSFVLEFTATPRDKSNVLVSISAQELKDEKMIKMPIYLSNKTPWQDTIYEGLEKLKELEKKAKKLKGEYIRPIMLIQAEQEKEHIDRVYVDKIVDFLVKEARIPAEEVVIQTATRHDLPAMSVLLSKKSSIRYIVTVNALKEGWDCPFAYVLVSVSNLGARLSVEQTIGRIMRLPGAKEKEDSDLNSAYVFASTPNFTETSNLVIKGLQQNGYENLLPEGHKGISVASNILKRKIKDATASVPLINIKDGNKMRRLDFVADLIGDGPTLTSADAKIDFISVDTENTEKIDIGKEGELTRDVIGKLNLIYQRKDFTKDDLLVWFISKIQRGFISVKEMSVYLAACTEALAKKHSISKLSAYRYKAQEAIENKIDEVVGGIAEATFRKLEKRGLIAAKGEEFEFLDQLDLPETAQETFGKHLYDKASKMNNAELNLAYKLDGLDNVKWWFRNPEFDGFCLQGWKKSRVYPDFIVKTKKGNVFVIEYKGEHLAGSEDTAYKEALGKKWQELAGKEFYFEMVTTNGVDSILEKISKS